MRLATNALAVLALLAPAMAQQAETHARVRVQGPLRELTFLEIETGAIFNSEAISLPETTQFSFIPVGVEWVGDEIWMPSSAGLLRYESAPVSFIEALFVADGIRNVVPMSGGAMLFGLTEAIEVNLDGVEIQRIPFVEHEDIIRYQGGFIGIPKGSDEVRRYDSDLIDLGPFAANASALVAGTFGLAYFPERLTLLANGRVAMAAGTTIVLVDTAGVAQRVLNPTILERDALETGTGQLFIPSSVASCLVDSGSGEAFFVGGFLEMDDLTYYSSAKRPVPNPVSRRVCSTAPNSVGDGAIALLLGSENLDFGSLTVASVELPPGEIALSVYGQGAGQVPFGDGFLCVAPGLIRTPIQTVSQGGSVSTQMDLATPGLGAELLPGTTWVFQTLYRDAAVVGGTGFNASDAVSLTFRP